MFCRCRGGKTQFTSREILQLERNGLRTKSDLDPALVALEEAGLIRRVEVPPGPKGGAPRRLPRKSRNPGAEMSKWLDAAQSAIRSRDKTDKTQTPTLDVQFRLGRFGPVLLDLSVLSDRGQEASGDLVPGAQGSIIAAIRAGKVTPGSIATATKLGGTATCQEHKRMAKAGLVEMARNGAYRLASGAFRQRRAQP